MLRTVCTLLCAVFILAAPCLHAIVPGQAIYTGSGEFRVVGDKRKNYVAIAGCGTFHRYGALLEADGTLSLWDCPDPSSVRWTIPAGVKFSKITGGDRVVVALTTLGTVVVLPKGDSFNGAAKDAPEGLTGVVDIAVGNEQVYAVKSDGSFAQWGYGNPISVGLKDVANGGPDAMNSSFVA